MEDFLFSDRACGSRYDITFTIPGTFFTILTTSRRKTCSPDYDPDPTRETILCGPPAVTEIQTCESESRTSEDVKIFLLFTGIHPIIRPGKDFVFPHMAHRL